MRQGISSFAAGLSRTSRECPNCFVILDTTKKTIQVYKGVLPQTLPQDVHARLLKAVERKCSERKLRAGLPGIQA